MEFWKPYQNPLDEERLRFSVTRKLPMSRLMHSILFYECGCYLLSGQRGSGKTTLVNQLMHLLRNAHEGSTQTKIRDELDIPEELLAETFTTFVVKVDIAKVYDELTLLERILRNLTEYYLDLVGSSDNMIFGDVDRFAKQNLTSFVANCKDLLDFKQSITSEKASGRTTSFGVSFAAQYRNEINTILRKDEVSVGIEPEILHQVEREIQKSISWETREYSIESIEARIQDLIQCFSDSSYINRIYARNIASSISFHRIENAIRDSIGENSSIDNISEIMDKLVTAAKNVWNNIMSAGDSISKKQSIFDKIIIIVDDTDKIGYDESIRVLNNLRGLLQSSKAFFLFVGSEEFYEDWYSYNAPGTRPLIDSLFHQVYYLPVLSIAETRELLLNLSVRPPVSYASRKKLYQYAEILLFLSQGLPRQLIRTLDLISSKQADGKINVRTGVLEHFNKSETLSIIRKFINKYTLYRDPRYEKCLYIALMIVSSADSISMSELKCKLEENPITSQFSPIIRNRIVNDVLDIVSVLDSKRASTMKFLSATPFALLESENKEEKKFGGYLLKIMEGGRNVINPAEIETFLEICIYPIAHSDHFLTKMIDKGVLVQIDSEDNEMTLGAFTFVIGPREIEGIEVGNLSLRDIVDEQRTSNELIRLPKSTRSYLING